VPGILGVVDPTRPVDVSSRLVAAMAGALRVHDGLRVEVDDRPEAPAVLGRVDLGVLDPSPVPARSPDGRCRAVLHGEIADRSASDVLAAYLTRGEAALHGLSGSFALALWDGRARRLHLVNDRFGLRNVYWTATRDRLLFAPLVRALLVDPRVSRTLDGQAAAEFLVLQCVLDDRTLVDGVRLLPPASLLVFEPGRGVRIETTWRLRYRASRGDAVAPLVDALRAAGRRAMRGGLRIGLPLSGGLDSRTLLAAMPGRPLRTITYGRAGSDDLALAARLAALACTEHREIVLPPGYIAAEARTMVERTDGMHSCLNAHAAVLREAGAVCDVVVLGNGGDCLLDGLWPGAADASSVEMATRLLPKLTLGMPAGIAAAIVAPEAPFADPTRRAGETLRRLLDASDGDTAHDRADAFNVVQRHRRWVLQGVPAQATHVDFRHPYYDDAVVEAALAVPAALRADRRGHIEALRALSPALARVRRQGKPFGFTVPAWRWQLHVAANRVRDAVRWRANRLRLNPFVARPKRGSFADYDDELRHGSRALLDVLVTPAALGRGWWRPDAVRRAVAEHASGRANHAGTLGVMLTLELFAADVLAAAEPPAPLRASA
jgi:asparagine synthase (glutamine-hydrolysing)